jgi:hypothetical protein
MKRNLPLTCIAMTTMLLLAACNLPKGGTTSTPAATVALPSMTQAAQGTPAGSTTTPEQVASTETPTLTATLTMTTGPTNTETLSPTPSQTKAPTNTPIPDPGTIAGSISGYPYGAIPSLALVAFNQDKPGYYSYWITVTGQTSFSMTSSYLLPGHYQVVAYDADGHTGGCTTIALVKSNETVTCDITAWGGGYPAKPAGVPSP